MRRLLLRIKNRLIRDFFIYISESRITRHVTGGALIRQLNFFFSKFKFLTILRNPYFKKFIDKKFLVDPLSQSSGAMSNLTILIPCTAKDFAILPSVIKAARINVRNPITEIVVVTPDKGLELGDVGDIRVLHDDIFLATPEVRKIINELDLNSGWLNQQLIKILFCLQENAKNVLILDADTVLTKPKYFICEKVQVLSFAYEYHAPYMRHLSGFCPEIHDFGLTFVTHHQLWQKDIVHEIWDNNKLGDWLSTINRQELSPISEYHTYGLYTYNFHSDRVMISRFGNEQYSRKELEKKNLEINEVIELFPNSCSVSLHSYS